ncbi:sensor histidine kinase [Microbacterium galbinum]|uniref:sensor histidine kinase n=1 Tax=Microbacterium galbinum TaxID=2851646 RepID=UPI001FFC6918|nr:histidine kinase [Microbacterium galbinum]MCK2029699.1 hypothetical protein [Microbacterium galbinum]
MSASNPSSARSRGRAVTYTAGSIALLIVGAVLDICAVANVPGAATYPTVDGAAGGALRITPVGVGIALFAIAAWFTVLWRRRHPLVVVIAGGVLAVVGTSYLLLLIGAVALIRQKPTKVVPIGAVVGGSVLLFALREALTPWGGALPWFLTTSIGAVDSVEWNVAVIVCALVSLGIAAGSVALTRTRDRAERSEQRAAVQTQRADVLAEQTVRQAERERIARDMHDALAHRLSVVSLHAGALEAVADAGVTGQMARTVREQTHAALQDMRGLIGELRSGSDAESSAPATMRAVGALVAGLRGAGHAITSLILIESPERAGALFDGAVFRIVQESLTNAVKHAPRAPIDLIVQVSPESGARIRVVNPVGAGVPAGAPGSIPGGGNGVLGIRERATALGGQAWIGGYEGSFIVDVTLPWQERG